MRRLLDKFTLLTGSALALGLLMLAVTLAQDAWADSPTSKSGERIVVIHDGDTSKGILTKANTVRQAIKEAGIPLDVNDLVEPRANEELVASSYDVNIYRARPVTIIDGTVRKKVMSAYRTPNQIVEHAGIELRDEDTTEMKLVMGIDTGIELTIQRALPVDLVLYGQKMTVYTQAKTVAAMLKDKAIVLGSDDALSVDPKTPLSAGMGVEVWRDGTQTITEEEAVQFEVEKIQNADREVGFREVRTKGVPGKRSVTYEIEMKNGKEVSRKEIQSVVLTKPKKQVEVVGAKPAVTPYTGGGNKDSWLAASAIPRDQWGNAEWLVQKESGWNPNAVNPSSGACGLGQQLPCGKWAGAWNDPVASLNGMHGYVIGRYGSWDAAVAHSRANGWY